MKVMRSFRILSGLLVAFGVLELAPAAQACSPPLCPPPIVTPAVTYLPGDMIYFKVLANDPGPLSLRTIDDEPVAASVRTIGSDRVFAPEAPVAEGTVLVLSYTTVCLNVRTTSTVTEYEFTAGPHDSLELRPGELVVREQGTIDPGQPEALSFLRLAYRAPDANGAAQALMSHRFTVDGQLSWPVSVNGEELIELVTGCSETEPVITSCGNVVRMPPGSHRVLATTTILGQTTQPEPVELEVNLTCPRREQPADGSYEPDTAADAGLIDGVNWLGEKDVSEEVPLLTATPTGLPPGDVSSSSSPVASSGCALPHQASRLGVATSSALALVGLAWLRRRSAQPRAARRRS